jgi:hypothetical protein
VLTALQTPLNNRLHAPPHVTTAAVTNGCEAAVRDIMGYDSDENRIVHINVISLCTQTQSKAGATWQCVDVGKQRGWQCQHAAHTAALELMLNVLKLTGETLEAHITMRSALFHNSLTRLAVCCSAEACCAVTSYAALQHHWRTHITHCC